MKLKISDIVEMLQVSERTIYRWIKSNRIPSYRINGQYRFDELEINEWIANNKIMNNKANNLEPVNLPKLLSKGNFYEIEGDSINNLLKNMIYTMNFPFEINKNKLINKLIEREEILSTGIGNGIAIPHLDNNTENIIKEDLVSVFFLKKNIDYNSLDEKKVHTLILILTTTNEKKLELLSKISFLAQHNEFIEMLKNKEKNEIVKFIKEKKIVWDKIIKKKKKSEN